MLLTLTPAGKANGSTAASAAEKWQHGKRIHEKRIQVLSVSPAKSSLTCNTPALGPVSFMSAPFSRLFQQGLQGDRVWTGED